MRLIICSRFANHVILEKQRESALLVMREKLRLTKTERIRWRTRARGDATEDEKRRGALAPAETVTQTATASIAAIGGEGTEDERAQAGIVKYRLRLWTKSIETIKVGDEIETDHYGKMRVRSKIIYGDYGRESEIEAEQTN